ncbi:hypothetical protein GGR95_003158 [Sulfitobacter undariae]|uniref:Uncharacterized protein n=1 Tax=Sulfitobacter undariae TaxID=1563671 RepID=A0A7W6EA90_9RHOB|nr:hypothetical protein [Sulfitobacter undariae]MBB3995502.1 hypothetical protein [Sulfitobacter undariae]
MAIQAVAGQSRHAALHAKVGYAQIATFAKSRERPRLDLGGLSS